MSAILPGAHSGTAVSIRPLESHADLHACADLQRATWGESYREVVPPSVLKIASRVGGLTAGAFDNHGMLLGFVFGITGVERGAIVHWSHMLAVLPAARNHGIGRRLKEYQRATLARLGAVTIYWTFDPLVARNAHLNVNILGVRATEYVENMYGESSSPLHRGIGTDRLIVAWPVKDTDVAARKKHVARSAQDGGTAGFRIEIPADIEKLQETDMKAAIAWRSKSRAAFQRAFASGLAVQSFLAEPQNQHGYYLLGEHGAS